jgi:membrane protease YdiL (CAAX protease family)
MNGSPKPWRRLLLALAVFGGVYYVSLFVVPSLGPIRSLTAGNDWIGPGTITQACFLIFSLVLVRAVGKGEFGEYGFRRAPARAIGRAALIALGVSSLVMFLSIVIMGIIYGSSGAPGTHDLPGGLLRTVITVWIVASTCEEIFYRGFLLGFLKPLQVYGFRLVRWRVSVPVLVAAATFGLGHLCLLSMMPGAMVGMVVVSCFICGLIAGGFVEITGSILPAVAVHMVFNITGRLLPMLLMSLGGGRG